MSQGAILYISLFGVKKCDIGPESTCFLVVIHLIPVGCLGPTLCSHESKWVQSVAVGSEEFVEMTKEKLSFQVRGRSVSRSGDDYQLREQQLGRQGKT